jgi:hypothetical protein
VEPVGTYDTGLIVKESIPTSGTGECPQNANTDNREADKCEVLTYCHANGRVLLYTPTAQGRIWKGGEWWTPRGGKMNILNYKN